MDNERPIEKLLRAFAKKRRDAAPDASGLELHPATRRLLQGEVARQYPRQTPAGTSRMLTWVRLLRRLAWAVPVLAVVGLGAWVLLHSAKPASNEMKLAENTPKPAETPAVVSGESDKAKTAIAEREESKVVGVDSLVTLKKDMTPATAAPAPVTGRAETAPAASTRAVPLPATPAATPPADNRGIVAAADQPKVATEAPTAGFGGVYAGGGRGGALGGRGARGGGGGFGQPAANDALSLNAAQSVAGNAATLAVAQNTQAFNNIAAANNEQLTQRFSQVAARAQGGGGGRAAPASQVLDNFQVEQNGNQLRVIDTDGSTYTGAIETAIANENVRQVLDQTQAMKFKDAAAAGPAGAAAKSMVADQAANIQNAQNYAFRVSGFNNTVKQPVVFTGNFVALTNAPLAVQTAANFIGSGTNQLQQAQMAQPLLQNSSINGTAQIGDKQQIQINAVPLQPPR